MHDGKALLTRLGPADQRIAPHQVEVVGDQHQRTAREGAPHSPRCIRHDQDFHAELGKHPRWETRYGSGVPLIQMEAPRLHDDRDSFEGAADQLSFVTGNARFRKAGNRAVGDADRIGDFVREKA